MFHPKGPTFFELARQALSSTQRGYDLLAPKFDYTPFRTPDWLLAAVDEQLRPLAPFAVGLDICCRTGAALRMLRPFCRDRVVGIDFGHGMLHGCRQQIPEMPDAAPVELIRGDALTLPFGPQFDIIVCFGAHGHILKQDEPRFIAEIARVLRPGGRFVFVTSTMPPKWSQPYWFARLFNAAMHVRNWLIAPPFIMYYLTFLLPEVLELLRREGLEAEVRQLGFSGPFQQLRLVIVRRPGS